MKEKEKLIGYTNAIEEGYITGLYAALSLVEEFKLAFSQERYLEVKYISGNMHVSTVKTIPTTTDNVYLDSKEKSAVDAIEWLEALLNARIGSELKKFEG